MQSTGMNSRDSWLATMACTLISFLLMMPAKLSGLLFVEILGRYDTDRAMATYPLFLCMLVRCSGGPLTGYCGERFGLHAVILAGCLLSPLGVGVCFFAEDMTTVIVFLGLVYGLGLTFSMTLFAQVLKLHFNKNLALAISMSMFGACFGGFITPPLIKWIFQSYGVSGTFLIMSGIMLNSVPFAMLLRYLKPKKGLAPANQKESKPPVTVALNPLAAAALNGKLERADSVKQKSADGKDCVWQLRDNSNNKFPTYFPSRQVNGEKLAKHFTSFNNGCQTDSNYTIRDQDKDTLEQTVTLLPKSVEPMPANTEKKIANGCQTDSNYLIKDQETFEQTVTLLPKSVVPANTEKKVANGCQSDSNYLIKDQETLEQTVTLLPKSVKPMPANTEKKVAAETKPVAKKPVSKQRAALQSLTIFLDFTFLIILVTQSIEVIVQVLTLTTMLDYSRDKGIDRSYEVYFLMALPLAEVVGRVVLSMIIDRDYMTKLNFTIVSFNVLAAVVLVIAWSKTFAVMMIGVVAFGLVTSGLLSVFPMLVFQYMQPKNYIMSLASRTFLYGPLSFLCAPLIGYFRGEGGSYDWVYYIQAIVSALCALLTVFHPHCAKRRDRREEKRQEKAKMNSPIDA